MSDNSIIEEVEFTVNENVPQEKIDCYTARRRKKFGNKACPVIELSDKIYQLRKQAKLTQKDMAKRLKIKQPTYARMENGQNMTIRKIHQVAEACNADVEIKFLPKQS